MGINDKGVIDDIPEKIKQNLPKISKHKLTEQKVQKDLN